jgi:hypothetical protein
LLAEASSQGGGRGWEAAAALKVKLRTQACLAGCGEEQMRW